MILFIGILSDPTMTHTIASATLKDEPHIFFDLHKFCLQGKYYWDYTRKEGFIDNGEVRVEFPSSQITGIYTRPISLIEHVSESERPAAQARFHTMFEVLGSVSPLVVNRPRLDLSNSTKMYHLHLLQQCGFEVPASLVTNDPAEAEAFIATHEQVIFKGSSSEKTIVSLYNSNWKERLPFLRNSPVMFQERITGVDVRVHLVGSRFFAERIECDAIDYRYEKETNRFSALDIPLLIQQKCLHYQALSGLKFIGFDFKLTEDGRYVIMEANPMPGYNNYDYRAKLAISSALLELLSGQAAAV